ncbi:MULTISPECIES: hypothetical protein [unclassified Streptomyces]
MRKPNAAGQEKTSASRPVAIGLTTPTIRPPKLIMSMPISVKAVGGPEA